MRKRIDIKEFLGIKDDALYLMILKSLDNDDYAILTKSDKVAFTPKESYRKQVLLKRLSTILTYFDIVDDKKLYRKPLTELFGLKKQEVRNIASKCLNADFLNSLFKTGRIIDASEIREYVHIVSTISAFIQKGTNYKELSENQNNKVQETVKHKKKSLYELINIKIDERIVDALVERLNSEEEEVILKRQTQSLGKEEEKVLFKIVSKLRTRVYKIKLNLAYDESLNLKDIVESLGYKYYEIVSSLGQREQIFIGNHIQKKLSEEEKKEFMIMVELLKIRLGAYDTLKRGRVSNDPSNAHKDDLRLDNILLKQELEDEEKSEEAKEKKKDTQQNENVSINNKQTIESASSEGQNTITKEKENIVVISGEKQPDLVADYRMEFYNSYRNKLSMLIKDPEVSRTIDFMSLSITCERIGIGEGMQPHLAEAVAEYHGISAEEVDRITSGTLRKLNSRMDEIIQEYTEAQYVRVAKPTI